MKGFSHWFLLFLLLLTGKPLLAQEDTLAQLPSTSLRDRSGTTRQADSARKEILEKESLQLQKLEALRVSDSLKRLELEQELNSLKSTDLLKKQELLEELNTLKSQDSIRLAQKRQKIDSLRLFVDGYAVSPFIDTLFYVYNRLGSLSAQERAATITQKIRGLADDYFFQADSLALVSSEQTIDIAYGAKIIMSISENDALWVKANRHQLAENYRDIIAQAVAEHKERTSWQTIVKEIALAILVLVVLAALIYLIGRLFRLIRRKLTGLKGKWIKGIKIRNYELFDANSQLKVLLIAANILKWLLILIAVYLSLPLMFSIFPWSKGFADKLLGYFLDPVKMILLSIWDYLPNLFMIVIIIIIFRWVLKGLFFLKKEVERGALKLPGFYTDWANPTYQIIRVLILAFMLIVIFPYLPGSDSPVFKGVSVFLGVLFTFGSTGPLSNVIAGLVLTYMRAFQIGDRVKIGEVTGDIIEKTALVTRVRTIKNEIISIPNSSIMSSHTTNFSSDAPEKGLIVHTTVTIGYDAPWRKVYQLLIDAALATELVEKEPPPFVMQLSLDDFYVSYQINAYTKQPNRQSFIYTQLHQNIQDKFFEAGVEIMSPHYRAMRDGNEVKIPGEYRQPGFKPPPAEPEQVPPKVDPGNEPPDLE